MKPLNWLAILLAISLFASFAIMACGDDDDDDDDDSATCDIDALEQQAADLCGAGGEVRYTGKANSDEECGATCESGEIGYWFDQYGACANECFCCGSTI